MGNSCCKIKYSKLALFGITVLLINGCSWLKKNNHYKLVKDGDSFSIGLNNPELGHFHPIVSTFNQRDSTFLYYFSIADTSIRIVSVNNKKKDKNIYLSSLFTNRINYSKKLGVYSFLETSSSLWIDSPVSDTIYQVDLNSLNILQAVEKTPNKNTFELYDFINQVDINSEKNELIIGIYEETDATFGLFKIQDNSIILKKKLGFLPNDYNNKEMYIYSGMLTKLGIDSFIISYYYSDSVDLYIKNSFSKRICLRSDSSINFQGFEGDKKNLNDIKKFFLMNQRYNNLFYDNKNKLYYRTFSFEKESNGKIEESKKWSICIFDSNFVKIHEEIFNVDDYYKGYILMFNSNLYIANSKKSIFNGIKDSSTIFFDSFKLKTIED